MEFGDWVAKTRKSLGLDVRSFAEKTKVDASTISRIENKETQATFYTAFRICEGLGISFTELFHQLKGQYTLPWFDSVPSKDVRVLSVEDVENFIFKFYFHGENTREILANLLNEISHLLSKDIRYRMSAGRYVLIEVRPEDIDKMLFGSRLFTGFHLQYPWEISANIILDTFLQKGVLVADDVDVVMQDTVMKGRGEHTLLKRLQGGVLERIRLADVLKFDNMAGYNDGTIMRMYWEVCRSRERYNALQMRLKKQKLEYEQLSLFDSATFDRTKTLFDFLHPNTSKSLSDQDAWISRLADVYIRIYRWFQFLASGDLRNPMSDDLNRIYMRLVGSTPL